VLHSVEWYIITDDPEINNGSISGVVQVRVVFRYDPEREVDSYSDMSVPVHQYTRPHVPYDLTGHEQLPVLKYFILHKLCWQRFDPTRDTLVLTLSGNPSKKNMCGIYMNSKFHIHESVHRSITQ
jgi:hypothetical protein